jgi:kynurenine formamidase
MADKYGIVVITTLIFLVGCEPGGIDEPSAAQLTWAASGPPEMSRSEFDQLMQEVSNWGRWGEDDQLGTLNLITPAKRRDAASLVKDGVTVSLALNLNKQKDAHNTFPFEHQVYTGEFGGHQVAIDSYSVSYHGFAHSHMDGLQHFAHNGMLYNGMPYENLEADGTERLGIQNVGLNGIFTRGVLIDMPRFLGVDYLPAGSAIGAADLEAWEKASGVTIASGDVLLIRTGRWVQVAEQGQWILPEKAAGSHASLAVWLKARDVAVIGCDGVSDVIPSGVEGLVNPLHELVLVGLGMPILDNLDLEALAAAADERGRSTFLFVGAPLRVSGGTGSPLNPLAVF